MKYQGLAVAALVSALIALTGCGGGGGEGPGTTPSDTVPPDTTLTGGPATPTAQTSASFVLASSETNSTYEVSLDGSAYAAVSSPYQISGLSDGLHSLNARAKDAAGNLDASPASFSWTVDTTAPGVTLQFPGTSAYTDQSSIRLRGTAIDPNLGTITNITVNGAPVTTNDAFRHWTATLNVATGVNTYTFASTDVLGNTTTGAATVTINNRGLVLRSAASIAFDGARNRLLVADLADHRIVAIRLSDGVAELFSGEQRGTGPLAYSGNLVMDAPRNRLLVREYTRTIAIDLDTGDRTDASSPEPNEYSIHIDYDAVRDTAYSTHFQSVVAKELVNDTRRIVTSNAVGTGPALVAPLHVLLDTSAAGGGQRLLVDAAAAPPYDDLRRIFAVDLATGNRTVLYSSAPTTVGSGVVSNTIDSMTLDAPNNRVLVSIHARNEAARIIAIDLATGNRSEFATVNGPPGASAFFAYDGVTERGFVSLADRGRVLRLDPATQQFVPVYEALAGGGAVTASFNGLELERQLDVITLIVPAQTTAYGNAGVLRINPITGVRTLLTGGGFGVGGGLGTGPNLLFAQSAFVDTRTTAINAPSERLLVCDLVYPGNVVSVDLATGNRSLISSLVGKNVWPFALDAQNGRLLSVQKNSPSSAPTLESIDITSGAVTPISTEYLGTGPYFSSGNAGGIAGVGIDRPTGSPTRFIVASSLGRLLAVDPSTGNRTLLFPPGNPQVIPQLISMYGMDLDSGRGRVYLLSAFGAIFTFDLASGGLALVTGSDPYFPNSVGGGPSIGTGARMRVDPLNDVIYAISNMDTLIAVDPATGQRAIVSR